MLLIADTQETNELVKSIPKQVSNNVATNTIIIYTIMNAITRITVVWSRERFDIFTGITA